MGFTEAGGSSQAWKAADSQALIPHRPRNSTQWSLAVFVKQRFAGDASQ